MTLSTKLWYVRTGETLNWTTPFYVLAVSKLMQTLWWSMQGPIGFFSILKISSNLPLYTFLYTIKNWLGSCILAEITQLQTLNLVLLLSHLMQMKVYQCYTLFCRTNLELRDCDGEKGLLDAYKKVIVITFLQSGELSIHMYSCWQFYFFLNDCVFLSSIVTIV